jgi:hypothetical protein
MCCPAKGLVFCAIQTFGAIGNGGPRGAVRNGGMWLRLLPQTSHPSFPSGKGTLKPRTVFNFGKGTSCRQRCVLRTRVTASSSSSGRLYIVKVLDDFISRLMGNSFHHEFSTRVVDHSMAQRREGRQYWHGWAAEKPRKWLSYLRSLQISAVCGSIAHSEFFVELA